MANSTVSILMGLVCQHAAYVAGLSWIAWHYERRRGMDAFYLMLPLLFGSYCTWFLAGIAGMAFFTAVLAGAILAIVIDATIIITDSMTDHLPPHILLLAAIVLTVTTLALFEFMTGYQPLGIRYGSFLSLSLGSILLLCSLAVVSMRRRDPYLNELRLGVQGRQIAQGWRLLRPYPGIIFSFSYIASWFAAVALPIATTGVTSYRLLRDIIVALLVARLVGARKPWLILLIALTIGIIRVSVAYLAVGVWAASVAEATIVIAAILTSRLNALSRIWSDIRV